MNEFQQVINELLRGIALMINTATAATTKVYNGLVTQQNADGKYEVIVNNKTYTLPHYGENGVQINQIVKVIVPQGNMSIAFFI